MKKLLTLATLAAVVGATALPAAAANPTGNVTVKWNVAASGTLTLNQNYNASGSAQTTAPSIVALSASPAAFACTAAGAGSEAAGTVNFGNITPDSAAYGACQYKNAINAVVTTNDTSWNLQQNLQAALPTNYKLCAVPNGFTWGAAGGATLSATQSTASNALAMSTNSCAAAAGNLSTTAANAITESNAFSATPANVGEDYELIVPPLAGFGAQTATVVYTLVLN